MTLSLLPRIRVNFKLGDLFRSLFVTERQNKYHVSAQEKLSNCFDGRRIVLCSSGRAALYQILVSLPQSKVMIPAYTCSCVVDAAHYAHKEIIFASTDAKSFNTNVFNIPDNDTIVLATHQYGYPCDIESIAAECKRTGALMIEDCAASFGYTINGKTIGTFGDYAIVSFNSSKLINIPSRGGAIVVGAGKEAVIDKLYKNIIIPSGLFKLKNILKGFVYCFLKNKLVYRLYHYLLLESRGKLHFSEHNNPDAPMDASYQYAMSEWQSYILDKQLARLKSYVEKRKELFRIFENSISNPLIIKPQIQDDVCCCRYTIRVKDRERFYKQCLRKGIDMDFSHSYIASPNEFIKEHNLCNEILNIPFYPNLKDSETKRIVDVLNSIS